MDEFGQTALQRHGSDRPTQFKKYIFERMDDLADLSVTVAYEWIRREISNMGPSDATALMEELHKVWEAEFLEFVREHYEAVPIQVRGPACEDCELDIHLR